MGPGCDLGRAYETREDETPLGTIRRPIQDLWCSSQAWVYSRETVAIITHACAFGVAAPAGVSVASGQDHVKETYYCNTPARG